MKITFLGAGSTVFCKNVLGDCMLTDCLRNSEIALYDIDQERLEESYLLITTLNKNINEGRATVKKYIGVDERKDALRGADFVVNAVQIGGNVINNGLITNLPSDACVEVSCMVDSNGINPIHFGRLPVHLAAMNMTNVNVQLMTIEAAVTRNREDIYRAAMLDPHTAAELSIDDIVAMCDEMIEEHQKVGFMKEYN